MAIIAGWHVQIALATCQHICHVIYSKKKHTICHVMTTYKDNKNSTPNLIVPVLENPQPLK